MPGRRFKPFWKALINAFQKGPSIDRPVLLRASGTAPVYLILSTNAAPMQRHWIIRAPVFNSCKFDWQKIRNLDPGQTFTDSADIFYVSYGECEYITDICVVYGKNAPAPEGYTKVPKDINDRHGGHYIYLSYRYHQEEMPPITQE